MPPMKDEITVGKMKATDLSYLLLPLGFSAAFGAIMYFSGVLLDSPTSVLLLALTPVVGAAGLRWREWRAWLALIMAAMSYEALAGLIDSVADAGKVLSLLNIDRYLWGFNFTGWFQSTLSSAALTDIMALLYQVLMPVVIVASLFIWRRNSHVFGRFVTAVLLTTYAALVTFLLFPTDPPWLSGAATNLLRTSGLGSNPTVLAPLAVLFEPNRFAAFPSRHTAYMVICAYFLLKVDGRIGRVTVLLTVGVLLSTLYLGQHYLVDLLAGSAYAILPCLFSERVQFFGNREEGEMVLNPGVGSAPGYGGGARTSIGGDELRVTLSREVPLSCMTVRRGQEWKA